MIDSINDILEIIKTAVENKEIQINDFQTLNDERDSLNENIKSGVLYLRSMHQQNKSVKKSKQEKDEYQTERKK